MNLLFRLFVVRRGLTWEVKLRRQRVAPHIFTVGPCTAKRDRMSARTTKAASWFLLQVRVAEKPEVDEACGIRKAAELSRIVNFLFREKAPVDHIGDGAILESVPQIMAIPADGGIPVATALQEERMDHLMDQHRQNLLRGSAGLSRFGELDRYPRALITAGSNGPSEQWGWKRGPFEVHITLQDSRKQRCVDLVEDVEWEIGPVAASFLDEVDFLLDLG